MPHLLCAILLCATADDPKPESTNAKRERLIAQIIKLRDAGKFSAAIKPAEELVAVSKQDGRAALGLAGLLARAGRNDEAFKLLDKAIKLHGVLSVALEKDDDFAALRSDSRWLKAKDDAVTEFAAAQTRVKAEWTITLPHSYDKWKPAPLIVALHGFSGNRQHMIGMWRDAADQFDAILVTPEGQVNADGGGKSWGGRGAAERVVLQVNGDTRRRLRIDGNRTMLTGFSQGGAMTYGFALSNPHTFRTIAPMAGPFSWRSDPKFKTEELKGLKVFIYFGNADRNDIVATNDQAVRLFAAAGCEVRMFAAPGVGHALPEHAGQLLRDILSFALGEAAASTPAPNAVRPPASQND